MVMVYVVVYLFQYITTNHISIYEVQKGQIMETAVYTGLILREETVTYADKSGSINFYKKEGDKAGYNDLICSVDTEGSIAAEITAAGLDGTLLSKSELLSVRSIITDYTENYSDTSFYNVYSFKENLNASVQENLYLSALEQLSDQTSVSTFSFVRASIDGVLAFYIDGYEGITTENFKASVYAPSNYQKTNLKASTSVSSGDAIYKTVTDENWYMYVPIDAEEKLQFETDYADEIESSGTFIIRVTFKKDDAQTYATATILSYGSEHFLQLAFNSSMVRYLSERYMEVELGSNTQTGLKIPNTAITQKSFLMIPSEYITQGGNSSSSGVLVLSEEDSTVSFVSTDIYATIDGYCYIPEGDLSLGDVLQLPDAVTRYTISQTGTLDGVFNMNKGYAVFKRIIEITSNEEYTIVETGTSYGLSLYDRIALDASTVEEGDFAN